MNENKTKPTDHDVIDFITQLPPHRQEDAKRLVEIMQDVTGEPPVMWGDRIIGFGSYHYVTKSGREGDWARLGFAPGKAAISLYLTYEADELLAKVPGIGKVKSGKGCIYLNKLSDVDPGRLRELIRIAHEAPDPS